VICDAEAGGIVGCVSLSKSRIERAWLPKAQQRDRPDPLPVILLGQLAVDLRWRGQGIARSLMFPALTTAVPVGGCGRAACLAGASRPASAARPAAAGCHRRRASNGCGCTERCSAAIANAQDRITR